MSYTGHRIKQVKSHAKSYIIFFLKFFYNFFFHQYRNLHQDSSTKYCQNNKERLQKSLVKNIEVFAKKRKKVSLKNEKQRVTEYRRRYFEMQKNKNTSQIKTD